MAQRRSNHRADRYRSTTPDRPKWAVGLQSQPKRGTFVPGLDCQCGKRGYLSRSEARTVLREMRRKYGETGGALDVYRCRVDDAYWHVGHRPTDNDRPNLNDPTAFDRRQQS